MTKETKRRVGIIGNIVAIIVCLTMLLGTTFAWFTDSETNSGNVIKSGSLNLEAYWAMGTQDPDAATWYDFEGEDSKVVFEYQNWEPGYTVARHFKIENNGSLALKYALSIVPTGTVSELAEVIDVYFVPTAVKVTDRTAISQNLCVGTLAEMIADPDGAAHGTLLSGASETATIVLKMQESADNTYQGKQIGSEFVLQVVATQFNFEEDDLGADYDEKAPMPWNGTVDTAWYYDNPAAEKYVLAAAEEIAGLSHLVDSKAEVSAFNSAEDYDNIHFDGQTIELVSNVDLGAKDSKGNAIPFEPIGSYRQDKPFLGTFDGKGNTISNMSQNTWELNNGYYYGDLGLGFFGAVEDATIKNVVMDNASISGESGLVGIVTAVAYGECTFENITVKNSKANDYQYYAGGIVGWASGKHEYINCNVEESTTIGGQWGDFNNANGGLIGGISTSGTYEFKNCTVACRIDAVNDVVSAYEWYTYRRSGMLVGDTGQKDDPDGDNVGTAIAPNVTCENVTVIYGDWANYHYCKFSNESYPWVRAEAGVSVDAYSNVRYGHPTDANGNTVVDENHVHNDGEKHNELIVFDQLFGGATGDRYATYGNPAHPGVTVIYNNK